MVPEGLSKARREHSFWPVQPRSPKDFQKSFGSIVFGLCSCGPRRTFKSPSGAELLACAAVVFEGLPRARREHSACAVVVPEGLSKVLRENSCWPVQLWSPKDLHKQFRKHSFWPVQLWSQKDVQKPFGSIDVCLCSCGPRLREHSFGPVRRWSPKDFQKHFGSIVFGLCSFGRRRTSKSPSAAQFLACTAVVLEGLSKVRREHSFWPVQLWSPKDFQKSFGGIVVGLCSCGPRRAFKSNSGA